MANTVAERDDLEVLLGRAMTLPATRGAAQARMTPPKSLPD